MDFLDLQPYDSLYQMEGFKAGQYLELLGDEDNLRKYRNQPLSKFMLEMSPIYMKFGFVPCSYLKDQIADISSYVYLERALPTLDDIPQDVMDRIIEEVDQIELQFTARKKKQLIKTRKIYIACFDQKN